MPIISSDGFWDGEGAERRFWPTCDYPTTQKCFVEANKIQFWVETEGQGPPLVLVHGGPGIDHRVFHPAMSSLAPNHKLIYYDMRGHYMSSEPSDPTAYGLEQDARDLDALRQALGLERPHVLGFSYGGAVALKCAALFPESVRRLIVCSTPVGMTIEEVKQHSRAHPLSKAMEEAKTPEKRYALFEQFYFYRPLSPECRRYKDLVQQAYGTAKNKRVLAGYERKLQREWDDLITNPPLIEIPVLFVFGRHDPLISLERAQQWVARLKQAKMVIFEESSHHPFVDEPEGFTAQVLEFLNAS